ncbi:MAG: bifunctional methylenetetrahydrofolate dehydrogenase/methenyltetrahydrofolate cyclohydrolase FolD [Alphaproteobacteria bacterium]
MTAHIIDGKKIAEDLRSKIKDDVGTLATQGKKVGLAVILVGDDPASHVYVGSKIKACEEVGIQSFEHRMDETATEQDIRHVIKNLNQNPDVHGILLQLPLPHHLAEMQESLVQMIAPEKDVDGLTTVNGGKLFLGHPDGLVPCTPQGSLLLIKSVEKNLSGKNAVVIGRSNLFGKPMAQLLLQENCTVTIAHTRTQKLASVCKQADILVAAVGRPEMVKADWVKKDAIVIDVGINRLSPTEEKPKGRLVGDVDYAAVKDIASAITPVPGGVGPMTITCLLANTVKAAK